MVGAWKFVDVIGGIVPRQNFVFVDFLNFLSFYFLRIESIRLALTQMVDLFVHEGSLSSPIPAVACFFALDEAID